MLLPRYLDIEEGISELLSTFAIVVYFIQLLHSVVFSHTPYASFLQGYLSHRSNHNRYKS
jgi:hypothetical protein